MSFPAEASVDLPARPESIRLARRLVAGTLGGVAPAAVVDDLTLATSELVTNAIEHGSRDPHDLVHVVVALREAEARVTVRSAGDARLHSSSAWSIPEAEARSGRGLGIVRQLADQIDVRRSEGTVEITVRRSW